MFAQASVGLELPSTRRLPPAAQLYIAYRHALVAQCRPRSGRLLPCRALGRELRKLLFDLERRVEKRIGQVPPKRRNSAARELRRAFRRWRKQVTKRHLTGHYLRLHSTERFRGWRLPPSAFAQLFRQLHAPACQWPDGLRLVLVVPLTPYICTHLLLQDQLAVYLHAPSRYATGQWWQVPEARVQVALCGGHLVVVVE